MQQRGDAMSKKRRAAKESCEAKAERCSECKVILEMERRRRE